MTYRLYLDDLCLQGGMDYMRAKLGKEYKIGFNYRDYRRAFLYARIPDQLATVLKLKYPHLIFSEYENETI